MLSTFLTITLQTSAQKFRDFLVDICALGKQSIQDGLVQISHFF
jgi:hypothetical protein